jgi:hypothetical protein
MPVQDLTPQLRTRLSRVERAVGWFVMLATVLLLAGFGYYLYHTAQRKGWFLIKLKYHTFVESAAGLHLGDPIMLMGFPAGQITKIEAMPPFSTWGKVYVEFIVYEPYYGYLWTDSDVKVVATGFLGSRALELTPGGTGTRTNIVLHASYKVEKGAVLGVWDNQASNYVTYLPNSKGYSFDPAIESPPVTERLEALANDARLALPGILDLTNKVAAILTNVAQATSRANAILAQTQPVLTNVHVISALLTNGPGALGEWAIPTNINNQIQQTLLSANTTLGTANVTLATANTNLAVLGNGLSMTLENVANITSNLNQQVQTNDQILSQISTAIVNADNLVQGLKRHWLLRSAFKTNLTNAPPANLPDPGGRNAPPRYPTPEAGPKTGKRLP